MAAPTMLEQKTTTTAQNASTSKSSATASNATAKSAQVNQDAPAVNLTNAQIQSAIKYNKANNQSICKKIQTMVGVEVDGSFGPITTRGIATWQARYGLEIDGKFGPKSKAKAAETNWAPIGSTPANTAPQPDKEEKGEKPADDPKPAENNNPGTVASGLPKVDYTGTETITKGAKGKAVKALQTYLNHYGFNVGSVDGAFGNGTLKQLMYYQYTRNLQSGGGICVDGNCGPVTWKALRSNASQVYGMEDPIAFSNGQKLGDVPSQRLNAGGVMTPAAASQFNKMQAASGGLLKSTTSTYRAMTGAGTRKATGGAGNSGQIELYVEWNRNTTYCARPGYSNHQSGKAADISGCGPRDAGNTSLYYWLVKNCQKYGFKRYSKESWHYDYVG